MNYLNKIYLLLTIRQRKQLYLLLFFLFISIVFELLSIGIIIPALSIFLDATKNSNTSSSVGWIFNLLGSPSDNFMVLYGLMSIVTIYLLKSFVLIFSFWKQSNFISEVSFGIGNSIFKTYLKQPYTFFLWRNSAKLIRVIQMEVTQFQTVLLSLTILISELSVIISILVFLIIFEPIGAFSIGMFMLIFVLLFHQISKKKLSLWGKLRQDYDNRMAITLSQSFGAIKDIKILGREDFFSSEFESVSTPRSSINTKLLTLQNIPRLYLELISIVGLCILIIVMMSLGKNIDLILPTLGVFAASAFRLMPSVNRIMGSIQNIKYAESVISLLYEEFNLPKHNKDILNRNIFKFENQIYLHSLNFTYEGKEHNTLTDIDFEINKGETIGIIGQSGSGKSTLVDILLGLLKPNSGFISVDGIDINSDITSWQSQVGYVPQSIYLIDDTLKNNIALGIPDDMIDEEALMNAIVSAQLFDFVNSLADKLDTKVGERGVRLSGGQRQRIGIARALYRNPSMLILDEATSSLDNETETNVMMSIDAMHGQKTIVIVAHRLTTLKSCDKIFKISSGRIVKIGTPNELF